MEIFKDIFVPTLFIALLATQAHSSETANSCVELELAGGGFEDNVTEVNQDSYVHISFVLTDKCQTSTDFLRVKVSTMSKGHLTTFCTIVFQENTCNNTDQSLTCHCINKGLMFTSVSIKVSLSDKVFIQWNDNGTRRGEKSVFLVVKGSEPANKTDEKVVTPVAIGICCCILVAVVFAVIAIKRGCRAQKQQRRLSEDRQMTPGNPPPDVTPTTLVNLTDTPTQTGTRTALGHQEQSQGRTRIRAVARLKGHTVTRARIGILTYSEHPIPKNHAMTATQNQTSQEPVYDRAVTFSPIVPRCQERLNDRAITSSQSCAGRSQEQEYDHAITFSQTAIRSQEQLNEHAITSSLNVTRSKEQEDDRTFSQTVTRNQEQVDDKTITKYPKVTTSDEEVYDRAITFSQTASRSQEETSKHVVTSNQTYQKPEKCLLACHNIQPNSNQKPIASPRSCNSIQPQRN